MQASNVALLLNRNARRVNERSLARIGEWVPEQQVYATRSEEESVEAVRDILSKGYGNVFAGGGDGTFVGLVNTLADERPEGPWPRLGVLRLGTGNALAQLVSSGSPEDDLQAFLAHEPKDDLPLSLIRDDRGVLFPFGGLGWDARILNDYNTLKDSGSSRYLGPLGRGVAAYFAAGFGRTAPKVALEAMRNQRSRVRITTMGDQAFSLGANGVVQSYHERGEVLYEGPSSLVMVGTTPYYGYGMKVLPFAGRYPSMFQIRVADITVRRAARILPSVWKGTYHGDDITDFAAESVRVTFDRPTPYQVAGDGTGERDDLTFTVSPQPLRLIRLI
jgi:diacylglycerol kinase family enzyme